MKLNISRNTMIATEFASQRKVETGKIVAQGQTNEIERDNLLPNGLYFIQVKTTNNQFVQKIIFN